MKIQKLEKERRATDSGSESQVLVLDELWGTLTAKLFREKTIGFTDRATEIVENPLVLQAKSPKQIEHPYEAIPGQPKS